MEPLVSICCIAYNHEKYIADALESFLAQTASFPFEIIVHDDASSDGTAAIIRDYAARYPEIIRPVFQVVNQFSQGLKPLEIHVLPLVRGKYLATCEGDDYWLDPNKLSKQVSILEADPARLMCFHAVQVVNTDKSPTSRILGLYGQGSHEIGMKEALLRGNIHLSSWLIRSAFYLQPKPAWIKNARHGDYAIALYTAAEGRIYYLDEVMSAYRTGVENSLMTKLKTSKSRAGTISFHQNRIETLEMADTYYNQAFHAEIDEINANSRVIVCLLRNDISRSARMVYQAFARRKGIGALLRLYIRQKCPSVAEKGMLIRSRILSK